MVKAWKSFSIFAAVALVFLLAPAAVLLPGENVAQGNGEAVTEEIEASFSFNVTSGGDWHTFQAGSGGAQPPGNERLALVQYTRQNVVIPGVSANVSGCGFRNYTTGSGTVTSTLGDLNGTMTLEWIAVRFNMQYSHTPKYATTTDFGWMWGRGHIDEGGGDNIAFVFIADLDCNGDMTAATGKGFIQSVEENGRFGNMTNPPEDRHKIIGDFDIALSGGTYTGTFHLRNYPPNEVYNQGMLNVTGGVLEEWTDDINPTVEILNMTTDGPMSTPVDTDQQPGFEEIDWGRDPQKTITDSDRLGKNATVDLTRNTILYLNHSVANATMYTAIQANAACVLHINDTYGVTGDDGSSYGELYGILLLSIPYQKLSLGDYFTQTGYTFCPFGTVNGQPTSGTGCCAGAESFADPVIYIESQVGNALQYSTDITYGLYPHPKVESVTPNSGFPGETLDVTIKGEYLLRVAGEKSGWVPNSGSVDFGPNITVNSYTIKNSSPIDNEITASITIDPGASIGARDVNVTSCFNYTNGNGTAPYKTGSLDHGFTVTGGATYYLTISSTDGGNVTTPGEGSFGPYANGTVVNISATPDANYTFVNWTGDVSTIADVNSANTTITMDALTKNVTANFVEEPGQVFTAYLTSPMDNSLFGNSNPEITLIWENITSLRAVPLDNTTHIVSTLFEYSIDEANWNEIGIDTYEGYEGTWWADGQGSGGSGWNIDWNTTGLTEGDYYIRTTMTDASDQNTTDIRQVYYDPTPPRGQFVLPTGEIIGIITIEVEPVDGYPGYITELWVRLYPQSGALFEQSGLGSVNQFDVGPNKTTDPTRNSYCAPTAAANALRFLAQKDTQLIPAPQTDLDIAKKLANKTYMNTDRDNGTLFEDVKNGINNYLEEVGRDKDYTVTPIYITTYYKDKAHTQVAYNEGRYPTWKDYDTELRKNEAVVLFIGEWQDAGKDGVKGTSDDNFSKAHSLTGEAILDFTKEASFIDPGTGETTGWLKWHENGLNGMDQIYYNNEWMDVYGMISVSPTDEAKKELGWETSEPIGEDYDGSDGWSVPWDSRLVPDELYVVEVKMTDSAGNYGTDTMVVSIQNNVGDGDVGGVVEFPQIEEPGTAIPDSSEHNYGALAGIIVGAIVGTIMLISAVWYVRRRRTKAI